jgi:hypothetical protein
MKLVRKILILTIYIVDWSTMLCQMFSHYPAMNLLLKFRVAWFTSLIEVLCCGVFKIQTDLLLVNSFPQHVYIYF